MQQDHDAARLAVADTKTRSIADNPSISDILRRIALRQAVPVAIIAGLAMILRDRITMFDLRDITDVVLSVSPATWIGALVLTCLSFLSVGQYDQIVHRWLRTGISPRLAGRAGIAAIAIGQTVGAGLASGALVRWRMIPGISLPLATRITLTVTCLFMAAWAVMTAAAVAVLGLGPAESLRPISAVVIVATTIGVWGLTRTAAVAVPGVRAALALLGLAAIDMVSACGVMWLLLPAASDVSIIELLPAFLLALGAGLFLATPGGLGPFEVAMVALLPSIPAEDLLGAIVSYRLVYYALPATIAAAAFAMRPGKAHGGAQTLLCPDEAAQPWVTHLAARGSRAEGLLVRSEDIGALILPGRSAGIAAAETGAHLVTLRDPFGTEKDTSTRLVAHLRAVARRRGRRPILYKAGPRLAAAARRAGFLVLPVAREAWLDPRTFDLSRPVRAGLRRKLRQASKSAVTVQCTTDMPLPVAHLDRIAAEWAADHGREYGFSMGRYGARYLAGQRVYVASVGAQPVAFASFHEGQREWVLDLVRQNRTAPNGTMHALIAAAIADAADAALPRLSLAAMPPDPESPRGRGPVARYAAQVIARRAGPGLAQFKRDFAPEVTPLYIAAPGWLSLVTGALAIRAAIRRPAQIGPAAPAPGSSIATQAQDHPQTG